MPTFYFDLYDAREVTTDLEGIDLTSTDAAQRLAIEALGQAILDGADRCPTGTTKVEVRDAAGRIVLRATAAVSLEHLP